MRLPAKVHAVLDTFVTAIDKAEPGLLQGLYLHGSLGFGEFFTGHSDIDFVAVVAARPGTGQLGSLERAHAAVAAAHPAPDLDGIHILADDLRGPPSDCPDVPIVFGKTFKPADRFELNPVTWHGVARHGITVRGANPVELGVWTDDAVLREFTRTNLDTYWRTQYEAVAADPSGASAPWVSEWCVLGVARLHHLLATGDMTSKSGAGRHALATFGERWHPLIEDALAFRETPGALSPYGDGSDCRRGVDIASFMTVVIDAGLALPAEGRG